MKSCNIYKTKKEYKIIAQSFTDNGLLIDDEPITILPNDIDVKALSDTIFNTLFSGKSNVVFPQTREEMMQRQKNILNLLNEKSYNSLYKNSNNCSIRLENNVLKITPSKFSYDYRGLVGVKEDSKEIDYLNCDKIDVVNKIIEILNKEY